MESLKLALASELDVCLREFVNLEEKLSLNQSVNLCRWDALNADIHHLSNQLEKLAQ